MERDIKLYDGELLDGPGEWVQPHLPYSWKVVGRGAVLQGPMISVICPVLNEADFIKAHIECCLRFADEIIYGDSGCTDGTLDIIDAYREVVPGRIFIQDIKQFTHSPYDWEEGKARNYLLDACGGEWICNLDADELWPREFFRRLPSILKTRKDFIRFDQYQFWYSPNTIRTRQYDTFDHFRRFYPGGRQYRLFRNTENIRYAEVGNHAYLSFRRWGKWSPRLSCASVDIPFHHYHWARGIAKGAGDNRLSEYHKTGIALQTYYDSHPEETKYYPWWNE